MHVFSHPSSHPSLPPLLCFPLLFIIGALGIHKAPIAGHVGDGNFHCIAVFDAGDGDEVARVHELSSSLAT